MSKSFTLFPYINGKELEKYLHWSLSGQKLYIQSHDTESDASLYPVSHEHEYPPSFSVQFPSQPPLLMSHSLISIIKKQKNYCF